jgi:hypothetical protein
VSQAEFRSPTRQQPRRLLLRQMQRRHVAQPDLRWARSS